MKYLAICMLSFYLCLIVTFWSVVVLAGYVFDRVHSYGGPTPMALDTAICIAILSTSGMMLSIFLVPKKPADAPRRGLRHIHEI